MSLPRFYVSDLPRAGEVELPPAESKHASQVLRLTQGADVILFDGQGGEACGLVQIAENRRTVVAIQRRTDVSRELAFELELWVALPKSERQKTLVEGLTQLGVARLVPLATKRGVAQPTNKALERLRRSVLESSKQCGRNTLMEVVEPVSVSQLVTSTAAPGTTQIVAHPYGQAQPSSELQAKLPDSSIVRLAIGPEGGFAPAEVEALVSAQWLPMSLGPRILRVEMAAIVASAAIVTLQQLTVRE